MNDNANDGDASSSSPPTASTTRADPHAARIPPPPLPPRPLAPIPFNAPYPDPIPITAPDPSARTLHEAIRHFRVPPPPPRPGSPPENPALRTFVLKPIKVLPMVRAYAQTGYTASELPSSSDAQDPAPGPNDARKPTPSLHPSPYDIKKLYNGPDKNLVPQGAGIYRRGIGRAHV